MNLMYNKVYRFYKDNPVLNSNNIYWKEVLGHEGNYLVSCTGLLKSIERKVPNSNTTFRVIKERLINRRIRSETCKYLYAQLWKNNKVHHLAIHRAVASAFIDNPENKPMVNHIDGNKLNNSASNLEWCTESENKQHAFKLGLMVGQTHWKGKKFSNTSKYHNVGWDSNRNKWSASVKFKGKSYSKRFDNEDDAAEHVNTLLDKLNITDRPKNIIT